METLERKSFFSASLSFSLVCHIAIFLFFRPVFNSDTSIRNDLLGISFLGSILNRSDLYHAEADKAELKGTGSESAVFFKKGTGKKNGLGMLNDPAYFNKPFVYPISRVFIDNNIRMVQPDSDASVFSGNESISAGAVFRPDLTLDPIFFPGGAVSTSIKLKILISSKGNVINVLRKTSTGSPRLDFLIMRNVHSWFFLSPALSGKDEEWREVNLNFIKN